MHSQVVSLKDSIQRHERNLIRSNFSRTVLAIETTYATQSDLEVKHMIFQKKYWLLEPLNDTCCAFLGLQKQLLSNPFHKSVKSG